MLLYMALRANCLERSLFYPHRLVLARLLSCGGAVASFPLRANLFLSSSLGFCLRHLKCNQLEERIGWQFRKARFLLQIKAVILNLVSCKGGTLFRHMRETFIKGGCILLNWPAYWSRTFLHTSYPMKAVFSPIRSIKDAASRSQLLF